MLIGELAKKAGLSKDTIRFYQKMGLITAQQRSVGSRTYMDFHPQMLERLNMISLGKSLGFTLNEIKHLMDTWPSDSMSITDKLQIIDRKLEQTSEKMRQLQQIQSYLSAKRNKIIQELENSAVSTISTSLAVTDR